MGDSEKAPLTGPLTTYRALRGLEVATYGLPRWAAHRVRDELLDLERGDLLRVASVMAVKAQLQLSPAPEILARRHRLEQMLLEATWRLS